MKKLSAIFISLFIILSTLGTIYAEETTDVQAPLLTSIVFENATIDGEFNCEIKDYKITVNNEKGVSILSYTSTDSYAKIKVSNIVDSKKRVVGINVDLCNSVGKNRYTFNYTNVKKASTSKNATLKSIKFNYGELSPKIEKDKFKYTLYIPSDLKILTINPVAENSDASVSGPVEIVLGNEKTVPVSITVISGDTTVKNTYKFIVKRLDMTVKEYEKEVGSPNFQTAIKKQFYQKPTFYIALGSLIFALAVFVFVVVNIRNRNKFENISANDKHFFE